MYEIYNGERKIYEDDEMIDINNVLNEYDKIFDRNDVEGARQYLQKWLNEAVQWKDWKSEFTLLNEMLGLYRKLGMKAESIDTISRIKAIMSKQELNNEISTAITWVNIATALRMFGEYNDALDAFKIAQKTYNEKLEPNDIKFASFYNNFALLYTDMNMYEEAEQSYLTAIDIVNNNENTSGYLAMTYANLMCLYEKSKPDEPVIINSYQDKIMSIFNQSEMLQDAYMAFVANSISVVLAELGFTENAILLEEKARKFYEEQRK